MSSIAVPVSSLPRPSAAELRRFVEAELADRIPGALSPHARVLPEMASSGIAALDELTGGWPRGTLTELFGPPSSGRTSVLAAALAAATARGEACAIIDAGDAFDPESAAAAGVDLKKLLWVRCGKQRPPQRPRGTENDNVSSSHPERGRRGGRVEGSLPSAKTFSDCHPERAIAPEGSAFPFGGSAPGSPASPVLASWGRVRQFGNAFPEPRDIGIWGYGDTETMERIAPHLARKNNGSPQRRGGAEQSLPFAISHLPSCAAPRLRGENPVPPGRGKYRAAYARIEQALKAADLLLGGGGFGLVAIDLAGLPPEAARRVPLTTWFRFRRAVAATSTVLLVVSPQPLTQSCAALALRLHRASDIAVDSCHPERGGRVERSLPSANTSQDCHHEGAIAPEGSAFPSHAAVLTGFRLRAEVIRSPVLRKPARSAQTEIATKMQWA